MSRQPSSIDRLPRELRELIGQLRRDNITIDDILAHLRLLNVNVSRSALGRHVKRIGAADERLRQSRELALALVDRFGKDSDDRAHRVNLELLQGALMEALSATVTDEKTGEVERVEFAPIDLKRLAEAASQLANARKIDTDRTLKEREAAKREAAAAASKVATAAGISRETVEAIEAAVLGVGA